MPQWPSVLGTVLDVVSLSLCGACVPSLPPALRHVDYRIFWTGQALAAFGTQFTTVARSWQIYELTNSPLQIGLLGLARAIPQMGLLLFGGLLADALDR